MARAALHLQDLPLKGLITISGYDNTNYTTSAVLTAAYSATDNDYTLLVDGTAAFVLTLPAANAARKGREYQIVQTTSVAGQVTVKTAGGTINGVAAGTGVALPATTIGVVQVVCDGTNWWMSKNP